MSKKPKINIVLASWPDQNGARYFGHADILSQVDGCDSFWLSFRAVNQADPYWYMDHAARAVSDIGLYVWFSDRGHVQVYFAIHDAHNMKLDEAEMRLKTLRWFDKRVPDLRNRNADSFRSLLMDIFNAIGVKHAIEYRHMVPSEKSTFIPIYDAVETIAKEFDKRYNRIRKSQ